MIFRGTKIHELPRYLDTESKGYNMEKIPRYWNRRIVTCTNAQQVEDAPAIMISRIRCVTWWGSYFQQVVRNFGTRESREEIENRLIEHTEKWNITAIDHIEI